MKNTAIKPITHPLKTGDVTVMSNVTSFTVTGNMVSRVRAIEGHDPQNPVAVHVDLDVKPDPINPLIWTQLKNWA